MDTWADSVEYQAHLERHHWPNPTERQSRVFVIDRFRLRRPVAQPFGLEWAQVLNWSKFCRFYAVVQFEQALAWKTAECSCEQFTARGSCAHIISMFRRLGGEFTATELGYEIVKGLPFSKKKGKKPKFIRTFTLGEMGNVSDYFPSGSNCRSGQNEVDLPTGDLVTIDDFDRFSDVSISEGIDPGSDLEEDPSSSLENSTEQHTIDERDPDSLSGLTGDSSEAMLQPFASHDRTPTVDLFVEDVEGDHMAASMTRPTRSRRPRVRLDI